MSGIKAQSDCRYSPTHPSPWVAGWIPEEPETARRANPIPPQESTRQCCCCRQVSYAFVPGFAMLLGQWGDKTHMEYTEEYEYQSRQTQTYTYREQREGSR